MYQAVKPARPDLWSFHDPGDVRGIEDLYAFGFYALSASTEYLEFEASPQGQLEKFRAVGPDDRRAWWSAPEEWTLAEWMQAKTLMECMAVRDRLRRA